ncbi:NlpC/P60 family protein, partial [Salmonella enterica]|uniref:NlpC/P60 family protein n=1 Tax=Salmonella enterica TaxID=28901 RepID=UPI0032B46F6D
MPPLETPRFAPAPKAVKSTDDKPMKAESATGTAATILDKAASMKGIFYRYGGEGSRGGWDCSAFVRHCFAVGANISLPRT